MTNFFHVPFPPWKTFWAHSVEGRHWIRWKSAGRWLVVDPFDVLPEEDGGALIIDSFLFDGGELEPSVVALDVRGEEQESLDDAC